MKQKVLIIEDDLTIQMQLQTLLAGNGYDAAVISDFTGVISQIKEWMPHLILMDIRLPGRDGFTLCSEIRTFSSVPIIFVTSSNTDMDELNSIMLGGDAFITKPYRTAILLAKIAALLKRAYPLDQQEILTWKGAALHLEGSFIEHDGRRAELTRNEMKILSYLFRHGDRICLRNDIIDYLWDNRLYIDDNTLSVNITRIRDKLKAVGLEDFIRTKHRQGYMI